MSTKPMPKTRYNASQTRTTTLSVTEAKSLALPALTQMSVLGLMTAAGILSGCGAPGGDEAALVAGLSSASAGAVYAMTNQRGHNEVIVYPRARSGALRYAATVPTQGGGSGIVLDPTDSLGSQGGLVLSADHRYLFAVNTETVTDSHDCHQGSVTVFAVAADGSLQIAAARVPSGGLYPSSVALHGNLVYVLNAGGPDQCTSAPGFEVRPNVTGFRFRRGQLTRLAAGTQVIDPGGGPGMDSCAPAGFGGGSPRFDCGLNPPAFPRSPGQASFTPNGRALVVSVKGTNAIYVFSVGARGRLEAPVITRSPGGRLPTYFGFGFDRRGRLIISEPFGSATQIPVGGTSAVSSFEIEHDGRLTARSISVANGQTTACWVAIDPRTRRFAYTANNGASNLSVYAIDPDGVLTHLDGATVALPSVGDAPAHPNELTAVTEEHAAGGPTSFLYSMNAGTGQISIFRIERNGTLAPLGEAAGLPPGAGAQGIAAF